jgi:hypothetical protein
MPTKSEIQKVGTAVYSKNAQSWHFPPENRRLHVFLQIFRVSISLLEYVGCFSSVMTVRATARPRLRWTMEGVDDWDKSDSLVGNAYPRRSTSSSCA